jgi:glyoxylase-like metal-dependent hydrolase (beta-lactamase superfamily II)
MRGSLTVGRVEVRTICEGFAPLPLADEAPGQRVDWAPERRKYPWAFADDEHWAWHVHAFLLGTSEGEVLVDTGVGAFGPWAPWAEVTDQAWSDVDPSNVRHVVLTHLHADHAGGGVLGDGTPRFPNARYHVHPADWTYFDERVVVRPSDGGRYDARAAMDGLAAAGALSLDAEDHEVTPGVRMMHTPGHTPGHRSVLVEDAAGGTLLLAGDLLHVPVQVAHPEWPSSHDEDPSAGAASREAIIGRARELGWRMAVSHFAHPFGRASDDGWTSIEEPAG